MTAQPGEPIAVALWRAGVRTQTRSIKFHRARGPQCFTGDCPGCMVRVDGVPNVRGCQRTVEDGMQVESQVGRPSAKRDVLAVVDRAFEHFDHERRFVRPKLVRRVYEAIARRLAGFGTEPTGTVDVAKGRRLETEVLVIGGGPAGLAAARAAKEEGAAVLHVDEAGFGGCLHYTLRDVDAGPWGQAPGPELIDALHTDGTERLDATAAGLYDGSAALLARTDEGLAVHTVDADATVLAVGAREGPMLVDGNDRPGVLGARAARQLLNRWDVSPGDPVAVIDPKRQGQAFLEAARAAGLDTHTVDGVEAIEGDPEVTGVRTPDGHIEATAAIVDVGLTPTPELGRQAGIPYTYEQALGGRVPLARPDGTTPVPGVLVAGSCAGLHVPEAALRQGRWAGRHAAGAPPDVDAKQLLELARLTDPERDALMRLWRQP